ncbi:MAG: PPOX class F420-dependent oxidoreductase [Anaerolineae bacterium]|nr:PPOX class F420-dependent oxidoreductase [Anaerolineae bacterium]
MQIIPASHHDLIDPKTKAIAYLATTMANGAPQVTPVWFNVEGEHILINSAAGRVKDRNMRARPQVALLISDPADPYRYVQVHGRVVAMIEEGAEEHIAFLAGIYWGKAEFPVPAGDVRVIYKIKPEKISTRK